MLKNIKLFSTDSDRTTYESSASYEAPYVSKVTADNSVHYNKQIRIIEFTVQERHYDSGSHLVTTSVQYSALEGMTWEEWIESDYNINYYFYLNGVRYQEYYGQHISADSSLPGSEFRIDFNNNPVLLKDNIVENRLYATTYQGSDPD